MPITISITLEDHQLRNLLSSSEVAGHPLDEHIVSILDSHSSSALSDSKILEIALKRVNSLQDGTTFTLKDIMNDFWDQIESPRAFGRLFKQKSTLCARYDGVNSSNKAVYSKYTMRAPDYLVPGGTF